MFEQRSIGDGYDLQSNEPFSMVEWNTTSILDNTRSYLHVLNEARERIRLRQVVDLSLSLVKDGPVERALLTNEVRIA